MNSFGNLPPFLMVIFLVVALFFGVLAFLLPLFVWEISREARRMRQMMERLEWYAKERHHAERNRDE